MLFCFQGKGARFIASLIFLWIIVSRTWVFPTLIENSDEDTQVTVFSIALLVAYLQGRLVPSAEASDFAKADNSGLIDIASITALTDFVTSSGDLDRVQDWAKRDLQPKFLFL